MEIFLKKKLVHILHLLFSLLLKAKQKQRVKQKRKLRRKRIIKKLKHLAKMKLLIYVLVNVSRVIGKLLR